ncbi:LysR family transcriptional regulator [Duganella sp. LX20W]|uniref:LysR family transcriptional regulator n=1 Tax=Rugamonas brunnea TaxID=2758569 RepID=A0A7W2ETP0_9BURK|nr:LysR family transcriptional regulator [Rugamonas brunnea]MBA5638360.1 LysR family transcriptional regulator [Rugamonas brunnea]
MSEPTILQLQCFVALAEQGSFAAAAERLHRTHPTVHAAVKALEQQLGLVLLDRGGYRVVLTPEGASFLPRAQLFLREYAELRRGAMQLANGEEPELRIVIGDLCPLPATMALLAPFFAARPGTRMTLFAEAISGPWERLARGECDLILHHRDQPSPRYESLPLYTVKLLPVAAPAFLRGLGGGPPGPQQLRGAMQCVIRDSSSRPGEANYHLLDGARTCSVPDQAMKRELILQGMAWGHMPLHLVRDDIAAGRLLSLEGEHLPATTLEHYATRRRDTAHGPVARALWAHLNT